MRLAIIAVLGMALSTCGLAAMFVHALHVPTKPHMFVSDFRPPVWTTTVRKAQAESEIWGNTRVAHLDVQIINARAR